MSLAPYNSDNSPSTVNDSKPQLIITDLHKPKKHTTTDISLTRLNTKEAKEASNIGTRKFQITSRSPRSSSNSPRNAASAPSSSPLSCNSSPQCSPREEKAIETKASTTVTTTSSTTASSSMTRSTTSTKSGLADVSTSDGGLRQHSRTRGASFLHDLPTLRKKTSLSSRSSQTSSTSEKSERKFFEVLNPSLELMSKHLVEPISAKLFENEVYHICLNEILPYNKPRCKDLYLKMKGMGPFILNKIQENGDLLKPIHERIKVFATFFKHWAYQELEVKTRIEDLLDQMLSTPSLKAGVFWEHISKLQKEENSEIVSILLRIFGNSSTQIKKTLTCLEVWGKKSPSPELLKRLNAHINKACDELKARRRLHTIHTIKLTKEDTEILQGQSYESIMRTLMPANLCLYNRVTINEKVFFDPRTPSDISPSLSTDEFVIVKKNKNSPRVPTEVEMQVLIASFWKNFTLCLEAKLDNTSKLQSIHLHMEKFFYSVADNCKNQIPEARLILFWTLNILALNRAFKIKQTPKEILKQTEQFLSGFCSEYKDLTRQVTIFSFWEGLFKALDEALGLNSKPDHITQQVTLFIFEADSTLKRRWQKINPTRTWPTSEELKRKNPYYSTLLFTTNACWMRGDKYFRIFYPDLITIPFELSPQQGMELIISIHNKTIKVTQQKTYFSCRRLEIKDLVVRQECTVASEEKDVTTKKAPTPTILSHIPIDWTVINTAGELEGKLQIPDLSEDTITDNRTHFEVLKEATRQETETIYSSLGNLAAIDFQLQLIEQSEPPKEEV